MKTIALPKNVDFIKSDNPNSGKVIIEPCYPGYGVTIGNALRRVLLSSLPGAAAVGVKIKGAAHEFMSLPHIKEDVLEIILNLKKLRLKVFSEEVVKIELRAHGEKVVTAGDITPNSQIEIINKDLVLAHITDMSGSLEAEISVSQGRSYETIESRENEKNEIGYIEMDSIFSPILQVGINIENTRVGKMTNWDKLILDIHTDGTITVEEAFAQSAKILIDQFSALVNINKGIEIKNETDIIDKKITEIEEKKDILIIDELKPKKRGRPKKED